MGKPNIGVHDRGMTNYSIIGGRPGHSAAGPAEQFAVGAAEPGMSAEVFAPLTGLFVRAWTLATRS